MHDIVVFVVDLDVYVKLSSSLYKKSIGVLCFWYIYQCLSETVL